MEAIIYPAELSTNKARLFASYSIVEQHRLEHNRVAAIARANPGKYLKTGKFRAYARESKARLKKLLAEQNRLIESIRPHNWPEITRGLSDPEVFDLELSLFGDRHAEKVKPTKATSPLLDELKAIDLDSLQGIARADPTEAFTGSDWNSGSPQSDPDSCLTVTADKVTFTEMMEDQDTYFYRSYTTDGDFQYLLRGAITGGMGTGVYVISFFLMLANDVDDGYHLQDDGKSFLTMRSSQWPSDLRVNLAEIDSGTYYGGGYYIVTEDQEYWHQYERDEAIGDYGTLYDYLCDDDYYDDGGNLVDTMSVALHSSKKDFDKLFIINSYNYGQEQWISGWYQYLDLQGAAPAAFQPWATII